MPKFLLALALCPLFALPAAAWTTLQGNGEALIQQETPEYSIELRCSEARKDVLLFSLARKGGQTFGDVRSVMLWIAYSDGRMGRRPIDVVNHGQYVAGDWHTSDLVLDEFRNAAALEIALNGRDIVLKTDMQGTGAARLAILEQCKF